MKYFFVFAVLCMLLVGCGKDKCFTPPAPFQVRIINALGADVFNPAITPKMQIVYTDPQTKSDVELYISQRYNYNILPPHDTVDAAYYIQVPDLPWVSLRGIKEFRLYRGSTAVDTFLVDVQLNTSGNCTNHTYESVKFNGSEIKDSVDAYHHTYVARIH